MQGTIIQSNEKYFLHIVQQKHFIAGAQFIITSVRVPKKTKPTSAICNHYRRCCCCIQKSSTD